VICPSGKTRYATERLALIVLTGVRARVALQIGRGWSKRRESRAYRCKRCHGWHLTSQPQKTGASS
jgi:cytochrome c553